MGKIIILFFALIINTATAQQISKPVLDVAAIKNWEAIGQCFLSGDAKYSAYNINHLPVGKNTVVIKANNGDWERRFISEDDYMRIIFTNDNKQAIYKLSNDTLCILSLSTNKLSYLLNVNSFEVIGTGSDQKLSYMQDGPSKEFIIHSFNNNDDDKHFFEVTSYKFNTNGSALILSRIIIKGTITYQEIQWIDLKHNKIKTIWIGENASELSFDNSGKQLSFVGNEQIKGEQKKSLWYYRDNDEKASILVDENNKGIDSNLTVSGDRPRFANDGSRIFFKLIEKPLPKVNPDMVSLDVWNYKDIRLQLKQSNSSKDLILYAAVFDLDNKKIIRLQKENEKVMGVDANDSQDKFRLIITQFGDNDDWWNPSGSGLVYLVSTTDGSRKVIGTDLAPLREAFSFSPDGKKLVYFSLKRKSWFSFDIKTAFTQNISRKIPTSLINENSLSYPQKIGQPVGIGGWMKNSEALYLYDDYDIWQVDPSCKSRPINITKGYGRSNFLKFRIISQGIQQAYFSQADTIILSALNVQTKNNGFYKVIPCNKKIPEKLSMGAYITYVENSQLKNHALTPGRPYKVIDKASNINEWLVYSCSANDAPNYYVTKDFKTYRKITDVQPQVNYNWLTTELVHWKSKNGKILAGILYKPENFDPSKKYPIIFNYYEQKSDDLNDYPELSLSYSADINIPYYVSRGYLVFTPDIVYSTGHPGKSTVNSVVSAANYLAKRPYVDAEHMGLSGHSHGGFETNYLITHSNLFAAAVEGAGECDFISGYGGFYGELRSREFQYEIGQNRIGATLWQRPDLFLENSPVLKADQVTTPLLILHNKEDQAVPFSQGVELFTALRRLKKKVWLLQYDNSGHSLGSFKKDKDFTIRMLQFFDYYLKGAPPPKWMTEGISARMKGIDDGLQLDTSGRQP
ncbi:MAG: prolyl oligopeptidase family serine peptidase [Bacteroidota bacterium]